MFRKEVNAYLGQTRRLEEKGEEFCYGHIDIKCRACNASFKKVAHNISTCKLYKPHDAVAMLALKKQRAQIIQKKQESEPKRKKQKNN